MNKPIYFELKRRNNILYEIVHDDDGDYDDESLRIA